MKIVVTDGFTLNPGDLSWDEFKDLGELQVFDRTMPQQLAERCHDADVIITNKTPLDGGFLNATRHLKMIAVTATGYNVIDIEAAKRRGVKVCNVPGYGTDSVAQHTFALILELANKVGLNSRSVHNGEWSNAKDWCFTLAPIFELAGKTLGVVGYGRIGQKVAEIGKAFGMRVIYNNPAPKEDLETFRPLNDLFRESDVVSLHCPLKPENHAFVNKTLLSLMKPSAWLINTARGQLINENDLRDALVNGTIAAAALDVLSQEPPSVQHPLIGLNNCIITPHNAWLSIEARSRIMATTIENVKLALRGTPQNLVN